MAAAAAPEDLHWRFTGPFLTYAVAQARFQHGDDEAGKVDVGVVPQTVTWRGGLAAIPENRGSHTVRSGLEPHTPGRTKVVLRVGGEPRKTTIPHYEERPGAACSRRDQECVAGWR